jgi:hypothetical protein
MRAHQTRPGQASACNDNGLVAIVPRGVAPRDVLAVAKRVCGLVALSYVADGCLLVTACHTPCRTSAAA